MMVRDAGLLRTNSEAPLHPFRVSFSDRDFAPVIDAPALSPNTAPLEIWSPFTGHAHRHSRAGGNPAEGKNRPNHKLGSRLRGNDELGTSASKGRERLRYNSPDHHAAHPTITPRACNCGIRLAVSVKTSASIPYCRAAVTYAGMSSV